ncbi:hypothetical protein CTDIVETGP_2467 [Clostridium tyrobutyricum DIVETGP]|uniref:Uncharacterized protein n=1 Tax=Clostridium tyrobutyricum DIVETGP TaxID=1408889 RepID=W6NKI0_CLOTY|nr:hypothetical protein CTDIVETGP_2467 [Clostridium tyrobutyricum DIVETGP]
MIDLKQKYKEELQLYSRMVQFMEKEVLTSRQNTFLKNW